MTNPQISAETIEALRRIDSATVANAIEHFEVRDRSQDTPPWNCDVSSPSRNRWWVSR